MPRGSAAGKKSGAVSRAVFCGIHRLFLPLHAHLERDDVRVCGVVALDARSRVFVRLRAVDIWAVEEYVHVRQVEVHIADFVADAA